MYSGWNGAFLEFHFFSAFTFCFSFSLIIVINQQRREELDYITRHEKPPKFVLKAFRAQTAFWSAERPRIGWGRQRPLAHGGVVLALVQLAYLRLFFGVS
jgi:hypothetical protein